MKRLFLIIAAALALAGCGTVGGPEVAAAISTATDAFTGPDTDYTNYLKYCRSEVSAQKAVAETENNALAAGLSSGNEKIQFGSLVLLAAKSGQGGPRIGCSAQRKKGLGELAFENSSLLDFGLKVYQENRTNQRFRKKLEADKEIATSRMEHDRAMQQINNELITTLSGDRLELQNSAQDDAYRRAQLPASP